uniref:Uncharacterized protein n=1 Tax=Romanomermis culicivorax TaxID=13658 RepID=A0A915JA81_ROMCU
MKTDPTLNFPEEVQWRVLANKPNLSFPQAVTEFSPVEWLHSLSSLSSDDTGSSPGKSMTKPPHRWTWRKNPNLWGLRDGCCQKSQGLDDADLVIDGAQWFSKGVGDGLLLSNRCQCLGFHRRCCW